MNLPLYLIDTHTLFWYEVADPQISEKAANVFSEAGRGMALLVVNEIVLGEFYFTLKKFGLEAEFSAFLQSLERNPAFRFRSINQNDIAKLHDFQEIPEMHDRLIAIHAVRIGATIVTRDRNIQACLLVNYLW